MSEFTVNAGDYIYQPSFTYSEVSLFIELAAESGAEVTNFRTGDYVAYDSEDDMIDSSYSGHHNGFERNITKAFREYLDNKKPKSSVSPSIPPKPIVAIHKEDNASDSRLCYYARDLKHLLKQMDNDQESLVDYELFNLGEELELRVEEKEL
jgi:hypothetical protein